MESTSPSLRTRSPRILRSRRIYPQEIGSASSRDNDESIASDRNACGSTVEDEISTFTCFQKLPAELRCKIWKYACFITRNLAIHIEEIDSKRSFAEGFGPYYFHSSCPVPPILAVCHESRCEASKFYSLDFEVRDVWEDECGRTMNFSAPGMIYINWDCDRVCIFNVKDLEAEDSSGEIYTERVNALRKRFIAKKLRYLAIEFEEGDDCADQLNLVPMSRTECHLEELVVFFDSYIEKHARLGDGFVKFEGIPIDQKARFVYPTDDIYDIIKGKYGCISELPPMPFDLLCSRVLLSNQQSERHGGSAGRSAGPEGTAMLMKGETWPYRLD